MKELKKSLEKQLDKKLTKEEFQTELEKIYEEWNQKIEETDEDEPLSPEEILCLIDENMQHMLDEGAKIYLHTEENGQKILKEYTNIFDAVFDAQRLHIEQNKATCVYIGNKTVVEF